MTHLHPLISIKSYSLPGRPLYHDPIDTRPSQKLHMSGMRRDVQFLLGVIEEKGDGRAVDPSRKGFGSGGGHGHDVFDVLDY